MVFSSFSFLFAFLPLTLGVYFLAPNKLKNSTLLLFSYVFYAWGAPTIVILLALSTGADFILGKLIAKNDSRKSFYLSLGIFLNLGTLAYYKYSNFFVSELNSLLSLLGFDSLVWSEVILPIGISFFTFQKISYLADVYLEKTPPAKSLIDYALFVSLFPQLIAGPIIRYHDISDQIVSRTHSLEKAFQGATRFSVGLAKKVLIADSLASVADTIFALEPGNISMGHAWLGLLCYSMQIYFDFSGYSDMAIGLGKIFGFQFPENFNFPYLAKNITEFWRRWHMTLSAWMKEYLYIPLGGNRLGTKRTLLNLFIVFFLSGLWHGASWNFILWGIFHGVFLVTDKVFWLNFSKKFPAILNTLITFFIVLLSWVIFRTESLGGAISFYRALFDLSSFDLNLADIPIAEIINSRSTLALVLAVLFSFAPLLGESFSKHYKSNSKELSFSTSSIQFSVACSFFILSALALSTGSYSPFLYFRF